MEKLKYCIKGKDTFAPFAESPAGTYYLNIDKRLVIFISANDMSNEDAYKVDGLMATIGAASRVENARNIKFIHDNFIRLEVDENWDPTNPTTYKVDGELELVVSGDPGVLYVDTENRRWYFKPSIKSFRNKLFDIFKKCVAADAENSEKIESILIVLETWKEISDDEIIPN